MKNTKNDKENVHKNHRERMRNKFRTNREAMPDHEIVEMLLYNIIPGKNTNEQAHNLLKAAGNLNDLLSLDESQIAEIPDLNKNTAFFFQLLNEFFKRMKKEEFYQRGKRLTKKNIANKLHSLFIDSHIEKMIMITVDEKCSIIRTHTMSSGNESMATISIKSVVRTALLDKASYVFLAHNHTNGVLAPSKDDIITTKMLLNALSLVGINIIEHYIVTDDAQMGIINLCEK